MKVKSPLRTRPRRATTTVRKGRNHQQREKAARMQRVAIRQKRASQLFFLSTRALFGLLLVGLCVTGAVFGWRGLSGLDWFSIKRLEIKGLQNLNASLLLGQSPLELGRNWIFLSTSEAELALLRQPGIAKATVRRHFPARVSVDLVEKEPVALAYSGTWQALFDDGKAMNGQAWLGQDIPVLEGFHALSALHRQRICGYLSRVREEKRAIFTRFSQVTLLGSSGAEVILRNGQTKVLLDAQAKSLNSLDFLEALLRNHAGEWRMGASVDLRVPDHAYVL